MVVLCSHQTYRPAKGIDTGLDGLNNNTGVLYDEDVVDACLYRFEKDGFELKAYYDKSRELTARHYACYLEYQGYENIINTGSDSTVWQVKDMNHSYK